MPLNVCTHVLLCTNCSHVLRLVNQDGSLPDLTMLSGSSVDAALTGDKEKQEEQGSWCSEKEKEKGQALVVVMDDIDVTVDKPTTFSDQRQSSTEDSHHCSAGTEPEPSTEQSSGTEQPS